MEEEVGPDAEPEPASTGRMRRWSSAFVRLLPKALFKLKAPLALLLSALVVQILAALSPVLVERLYARSIYPFIVGALSSFSRPFGFSLAEALIWLLLTLTLAGVATFTIRLYFRPADRLKRLAAFARFATWLSAGCLWAFLLCFGFNYQRPFLFDLLGFERQEATAAELETLGSEIIRRINENYEAAHASGRSLPNSGEVIRLLEESYLSTVELSLLPRGFSTPPKSVYFSGVMTRLGISGIYFPFTAEPNYNAEVPDFQLPFAIAHEMAHQRGVARESEANFVAFLVCVNSSDPFIRYSGYRGGLGVVSELFRKQPDKARELIRQLGPGYREDTRRAALFWAKAGGIMGHVSLRINDLYLRANRVKSGAADYAASTTLIIGYYRKMLEPGVKEGSDQGNK